MSDPRLSNCPFCRSTAEFWRNTDTGALDFDGDYARCTNDQCEAAIGPVFLDEGAKEHLARKWNSRPEIQALKKKLERAKVLMAGRLEDNKTERRRSRGSPPEEVGGQT